MADVLGVEELLKRYLAREPPAEWSFNKFLSDASKSCPESLFSSEFTELVSIFQRLVNAKFNKWTKAKRSEEASKELNAAILAARTAARISSQCKESLRIWFQTQSLAFKSTFATDSLLIGALSQRVKTISNTYECAEQSSTPAKRPVQGEITPPNNNRRAVSPHFRASIVKTSRMNVFDVEALGGESGDEDDEPIRQPFSSK
ncbi:hypothetical protein BC832DRAFT_549535 [Gaertneriomyces semiglobifer]|nr:hypothetical protein BC832DRAFT_549535 [Gaertneriomyces semiglobifer]